MTVLLGLCGCGTMGRRHVLGLHKLRAIGRVQLDLVAVCDPLSANGERVAALAGELLGRRPEIFADAGAMCRTMPGLDALDITTSPDLHAAIGLVALAAGLHIIVEKPIALTVRQGLELVRAARVAGRVLAVAENYRRDPINRLARAAVDAGLVGRPILAIQSSSGSGENVIIAPWRHRRRSGGIIVDMGVHYTDLLEYYLGPIESVAGMNAVVDQERTGSDGSRHPADAEDLSVGVARFRSGALASWVLSLAGRGEDHFQRTIYGTGGSLAIPADRTGRPLRLVQRRSGRDVTVPEDEYLRLVPDFALDDTTAALFGGDRLASYTMAWTDIDSSLLAVELDDFATAIVTNQEPDVPGMDGVRALALAYGFLESERLGRFVGVDELLSEAVMPYQHEIETTER